jgi:hypothetical protein
VASSAAASERGRGQKTRAAAAALVFVVCPKAWWRSRTNKNINKNNELQISPDSCGLKVWSIAQ